MPIYTHKNTKSSKKSKTKKNKNLIYTPKDRLVLRNASAKAISNPIVIQAGENAMNNLSTSSLDEYLYLVSTTIQSDLEATNSYTPSINKQLEKLTSTQKNTIIFDCPGLDQLNKTYNNNSNLLHINIGTSTKKNCIPYTNNKAREALLNNFLLNKKLIPSQLLVPIQKHANCWFNTMFMCFFISDKGRKFMKFFQLLMISGENLQKKK